MILDKMRKPDDAPARSGSGSGSESVSGYKYLDDLLDKTFITDYFMDRSAATDRPEK